MKTVGKKIFTSLQGPVAQSEASLNADLRVVSSIQAQSHTFLETDHEIISTVLLLPLIQDELLSVTSKPICTKYWLTALSQACPGISV